MNCPHCSIQIDEHKATECLSWWVSEVVFDISKRKPTHGNCCTCQSCGQAHDECICNYVFCIEEAWKIIEKMANVYGTDGHNGIAMIYENDKYYFEFPRPSWEESESTSAPLSICRAAIKAVAQ